MPELSHRRTEARVRVTDAAGRPLAGVPVTVAQTGHAFGFGNIGFDLIGWVGGPAPHPAIPHGATAPRPGEAAPEVLAAAYAEVFNAVTLPFYWRGYEPEPGVTDVDRLRATAEWFRERGITVKGHPLVWHTLAPTWLLERTDAEVEAAIRARIRGVVSAFAGTVDLWDAINEAVILPVFTAETNAITRLAQRTGRVGMVRMAVEEARAANPDARLVLNDFDWSSDYERLIADCLDAGIELDAIGVQSHMHQGYRGEEKLTEVMDRFAQFGLPLQLTETTLLSGDLMPGHIDDLNDYVVDDWPSTPEGEARQAEEIIRHYRNVVAHPAAESLTYWGLTDAGAWLGAPAGLLRRDGSRKPSFDALRALIRDEWWVAPHTVTTDADGVVPIAGFAGTYSVAVGADEGTVDLPAGAVAAEVRVAS